MKIIKNIQIDTSIITTDATKRAFSVSGDRGAKFVLIALQNDTIKYYDFKTQEFELCHNDSNNNLVVQLGNSKYSGSIKFPSGGGTYTVKLITLDDTFVNNRGKTVISKTIEKQASNATITFQPISLSYSNKYGTLPSVTSAGIGVTSTPVDMDWSIPNATTDAHSNGLTLTKPWQNLKLSDKIWIFKTTETVDGTVSSSTEVVLDNLTKDIIVGMKIVGVSSGSLSGTPTITNINSSTKTITINSAQSFAHGITLTMICEGFEPIKQATGLDLSTSIKYPVTEPPTLTQTVRADVSSSTTVTLSDTQGVAGGNEISYKGFGVDNSSANKITSVTPDPGGGDGDGSMVVQLAQTLTAGTVLTFNAIYSSIPFKTSLIINEYPSINRNIYLDLDQFITPGAAS